MQTGTLRSQPVCFGVAKCVFAARSELQRQYFSLASAGVIGYARFGRKRPPLPPRLGNPGVFKRILKMPGQTLYFSKRDAKAYFDQLKLPTWLVPFFGRPPVRADRLAKALNCSVADLAAFYDLGGCPPCRVVVGVCPNDTFFGVCSLY